MNQETGQKEQGVPVTGAATQVSGVSGAAKIGVVTAIMISVADMVGIGVFTSLGFQVLSITSGFSLLLLWVVGGVVALCGALSYAELAAAFPRSGGEYNFLSRSYHHSIGFMAGWLSATVGFAAPIALAAMAFGDYFKGVYPEAPVLALGLGCVWLITFLNILGVRRSSLFHNVATFIKIALILAFIGFGFSYSSPQPVSFTPSSLDWHHVLGAPFAISLVFVMYSYSGWNASTYIINEIDDPKRTLPRAIVISTLIVMILYILLNAVFLYTTPIDQMAGQLDVALVVGRQIFGSEGGVLVAGLICFGLISTISAMVWIGSRVTMVMGEDMPLLAVFSRKNRFGAPAVALIVQAIIVTVLMLTQSFESILDYIQFSLTLSSFLTVLGVIVLRFTQPDLPRPYKTWGYPFTPLVFLILTFFIMAYLIMERPVQSFAGLGTMLAGLVIYFISVNYSPTVKPNRDS